MPRPKSSMGFFLVAMTHPRDLNLRQMLNTKMFLMKALIILSFLAFKNILSAEPYNPDPNYCDYKLEYSYYNLCYSMHHRQALWAQHELTTDQIKGRQNRTNDFKADYRVSDPVYPNDFKGSGFDRGHLVPAADMKLNSTSMSDTFFMTNMSPQNSSFNSGIWNALEGHLRSEVLKLGPATVITAPLIISSESYVKIRSGITVPKEYYKIAYFHQSQILKAYLIPNKSSEGKKYSDFKITVDELEELTGLDFFGELPDDLEVLLESSL